LISLTAATWSAAFFFNQKWLFIIGLIIIAQELYEGAVLSAALKIGEKIEKGEKLFDDGGFLCSFFSHQERTFKK
jgi:hypothetical protein